MIIIFFFYLEHERLVSSRGDIPGTGKPPHNPTAEGV